MITPQPRLREDLVRNRPNASIGDRSSVMMNGQIYRSAKSATRIESYSTCKMPDSQAGVSLLGATYQGVMDRPEGERMKRFAEAILAANKCYIWIDAGKYRTDASDSRFVASLYLEWGGIGQAPGEARGSWYLGSAGADQQPDMWRQISDAISDSKPLPYKGLRKALAGCPSGLQELEKDFPTDELSSRAA